MWGSPAQMRAIQLRSLDGYHDRLDRLLPRLLLNCFRIHESMSKGVLLTRLRQLVWDHLSLKSYSPSIHKAATTLLIFFFFFRSDWKILMRMTPRLKSWLPKQLLPLELGMSVNVDTRLTAYSRFTGHLICEHEVIGERSSLPKCSHFKKISTCKSQWAREDSNDQICSHCLGEWNQRRISCHCGWEAETLCHTSVSSFDFPDVTSIQSSRTRWSPSDWWIHDNRCSTRSEISFW